MLYTVYYLSEIILNIMASLEFKEGTMENIFMTIYRNCDPDNTDLVPINVLIEYITPYLAQNMSAMASLRNDLGDEHDVISYDKFLDVMRLWAQKVSSTNKDDTDDQFDELNRTPSEVENNDSPTPLMQSTPRSSLSFGQHLLNNSDLLNLSDTMGKTETSNINYRRDSEEFKKLEFDLNNIKRERDLLKNQLTHCEELNEKLQQDLDRYYTRLMSEQNVNEMLKKGQEQIDELKDEISKCNSEKLVLLNNLQKWEEDNSYLKELNKYLECENTNLTEIIEKQKKTESDLNNKLDKMIYVLEKKEEEINSLFQINSDLEEHLTREIKLNKDLKDEYHYLDEEKSVLERRLSSQNSNKKTSTPDKMFNTPPSPIPLYSLSKTRRLTPIKTRYSLENIKNSLENNENSSNHSFTSLDYGHDLNISARGDCNNLQFELVAAQKNGGIVAELQKKVESLEKEIKYLKRFDFEEGYNKAKEECENKSKEIDELKVAFQKMYQNLEMANKKHKSKSMADYEKDLNELRDEINEKNLKLERLSKVIESSGDTSLILFKNVKEIDEKNKKLSENLKNLTEQKEQLEMELEEKKFHLIFTENRLEEMEKNSEKLNKKIIELTDVLNSTKSELEHAKREIGIYEIDLKLAKEKSENNSKLLKETQTELNLTKQKMKEYEIQLNLTNDKINEYETKLNLTETKFEEYKLKFKLEEKKTVTFDKRNLIINKLKEQIDNLEIELQKRCEGNKEMTKQIDNLHNQLKEKENFHFQQKFICDKIIQDLNLTISNNQSLLLEKNLEIIEERKKFEEEITIFNRNIEELNRKIQMLHFEKVQHENSLTKKESELNDLIANNNLLKKQLNHIEKEFNEASDLIDDCILTLNDVILKANEKFSVSTEKLHLNDEILVANIQDKLLFLCETVTFVEQTFDVTLEKYSMATSNDLHWSEKLVRKVNTLRLSNAGHDDASDNKSSTSSMSSLEFPIFDDEIFLLTEPIDNELPLLFSEEENFDEKISSTQKNCRELHKKFQHVIRGISRNLRENNIESISILLEDLRFILQEANKSCMLLGGLMDRKKNLTKNNIDGTSKMVVDSSVNTECLHDEKKHFNFKFLFVITVIVALILSVLGTCLFNDDIKITYFLGGIIRQWSKGNPPY